MNGRVVGTLRLCGSRWEIIAEPDIMIRLKRLLPGVRMNRAAALYVSDTETMGRELDWITQRWVFDMSEEDREHLSKRAATDRAREELITSMVAGTATVTRQPDWLTPRLALRDYQRVAVDINRATGSTLIVDELGLGKTLTGLALLENPQARPALAVTLTGWLGRQWLNELDKFYPQLRGIEIRTTKAGQEFPKLCGPDGEIAYDLIVMNYAKLDAWRHHLAGQVRTVIFDEVQELRGPETLKYEAAAHIASQAKWVSALTATPIFNFSGEMFALLDVISHGCLGERDEFMREWAEPVSLTESRLGKVRVRDPQALRSHLISRGLFIRRTREDVGISLPAIETVEQFVPSDRETLDKLSGDAIEMARLNATHSGLP